MNKAGPHFCVLPWVHASTHHSGAVFACSRAQQDFTYGSLKEKDLKTIWNDQPAREMRKALLNGEAPPQCVDCYRLEAAGDVSFRQVSNERYASALPLVEETREDGSVPSEMPVYIDLRFSNLCNLKCRSCEPINSTGWYSEAKLIYRAEPPKATLRPTHSPAELDQMLDAVIPGLQEIHLLGGEPLIHPEHYQFLEKLIARGRTDVLINYHTNMTHLSYRHWNVLDLWRQFKNISVTMSFDGIGAQSDVLRKGSRWSEIEKNFRLLRVFAPHVSLRIYPTVSVMNCFHLPAAVDRWIELGIVRPVSAGMKFHFVNSPRYYSIKILNPAERRLLEARYNEYLAGLQGRVEAPLYRKIESQFRLILNWFGPDFWEEERQEFKRVTLALDGTRNENFSSLFPELSGILAEA